MGWLINTNLKITEEEVDNILKAINAQHIIPGWGVQKSKWGWSAECDIALHNGYVYFSGAGFSQGTSLPNRFIEEARKRGNEGAELVYD